MVDPNTVVNNLCMLMLVIVIALMTSCCTVIFLFHMFLMPNNVLMNVACEKIALPEFY
jgi:hypothetical protein